MCNTKKNRNQNTATAAVAAAFCLTLGASALGQEPQPGLPRTIDDFIAQSDLVFHGTVTRIEYALSRPAGRRGSGIPHTFVTYRVQDLVHGAVPGEEITLRFMGGLNLQRGRFMETSITPQFDLGDEDVLFVRGNGQSISPLVAHQSGRLRIIGGQVYTDGGHSVVLDRDGLILKGDRYLLEEVMTTEVEGRVFSTQISEHALEGPSDAMTGEELILRISMSALTAPQPQNPFVSLIAGEPFDAPDFTPAKFDTEPDGQQAPAAEEDASEIVVPRKGR